MRRTILGLLLILFLGGFLRFYHLGRRGIISGDEDYYVLRAEYIRQGLIRYEAYLKTPKGQQEKARENKLESLYAYLSHPNRGMIITSAFLQDKDMDSFLTVFVSTLFHVGVVRAALYTQALFGTLNILLVFSLVLLLFRNPRMALLAGLFYAIFPLSLWYARSAESEEGAIFFCLLALLGVVWSFRSKIPLFWYCLTGIFLGCAFGMNGRMGAAVGLTFVSFCLLVWEEEREKVRVKGGLQSVRDGSTVLKAPHPDPLPQGEREATKNSRFLRIKGAMYRIWMYGFFSTLFLGLVLGAIELPYYALYLQLKMHGKDLPMVMSYWVRVLIDSKKVTHGLDLGFDNLTFLYAMRYLTGITCTVLVVGSLVGSALYCIRIRSIRMGLILGWIGLPVILFSFCGRAPGASTPHAVRYFSLSFPFLAVGVGFALDRFWAVPWRWMKVGGMMALLLGVGVEVIPETVQILSVRSHYAAFVRKYVPPKVRWVSPDSLLGRLYSPERVGGYLTTLRGNPEPKEHGHYWVTDGQSELGGFMRSEIPVEQRLEKEGCIPLAQEPQFDQGELVERFWAFDFTHHLEAVLHWLRGNPQPKVSLFDVERCRGIIGGIDGGVEKGKP